MAIKADVEVGGFDQLFNLLVGRDVQKFYGQQPQDIITFKMLYGLDGRKMSTSWGNVINILNSPNKQYGKIMSMKDELIINYFELATDLSVREVKKIEKSLKSGKLNPKDAKARLAKEIVAMYHSKAAAEKAEREFNRVFGQKKLPSEIKGVKLKAKKINILDLLVKTKLTLSKSEAKRIILQGGLKIDNEVQKDWQKIINLKQGMIVQVGKRKFVRVTI